MLNKERNDFYEQAQQKLTKAAECMTNFGDLVARKCQKRGSRIFVCDQDQEVRGELVEHLKGQGYNIVAGENDADFVETLSANDLGLLITDLHLPNVNIVSMLESLTYGITNLLTQVS